MHIKIGLEIREILASSWNDPLLDSEEDAACGCEKGRTKESLSISLSRMQPYSNSQLTL
jgi:CDP-diacylglycerol pyrophosphatase